MHSVEDAYTSCIVVTLLFTQESVMLLV